MPGISALKAKELILAGEAPANMQVSGQLDLAGANITSLPAGLEVATLNLKNCSQLTSLPPGLRVRRLTVSNCKQLTSLPEDGLSCYELEAKETPIRTLPANLRVEYRLDLENCTELTHLPANLTIGSLMLRGCTGLTSLPEGLKVYFLNISGCISLRDWPSAGQIQYGQLVARNCPNLRTLPSWLTNLALLDLRGCSGLTDLPENLQISSRIDLADTQLKHLPPSLAGADLLWRGILVEERIVFQPETITTDEILNERNAEKRRVLLERMGYEKFMQTASAEILDNDTDPGGPRQLLRVPLLNDEPLVCISVRCPSTAHHYIIRVPPHMQNCHQAAAWIAGFDNPNNYHPIKET